MARFNMNYVLGALAAALAVTCALSIHAPMRFDDRRAEREQAVKEPFAGGKKFDIAVNTQTGKSGRQIPLMECGAEYADYLEGLDGNSISNLIEEAETAGRYPGLKIGDLTTPNDNAGNWE